MPTFPAGIGPAPSIGMGVKPLGLFVAAVVLDVLLDAVVEAVADAVAVAVPESLSALQPPRSRGSGASARRGRGR